MSLVHCGELRQVKRFSSEGELDGEARLAECAVGKAVAGEAARWGKGKVNCQFTEYAAAQRGGAEWNSAGCESVEVVSLFSFGGTGEVGLRNIVSDSWLCGSIEKLWGCMVRRGRPVGSGERRKRGSLWSHRNFHARSEIVQLRWRAQRKALAKLSVLQMPVASAEIDRCEVATRRWAECSMPCRERCSCSQLGGWQPARGCPAEVNKAIGCQCSESKLLG